MLGEASTFPREEKVDVGRRIQFSQRTESGCTLLVQRPRPHKVNSTDGRKRKINQWKTKIKRAAQVNKEALSLLLKLASPTPSNNGVTNIILS